MDHHRRHWFYCLFLTVWLVLLNVVPPTHGFVVNSKSLLCSTKPFESTKRQGVPLRAVTNSNDTSPSSSSSSSIDKGQNGQFNLTLSSTSDSQLNSTESSTVSSSSPSASSSSFSLSEDWALLDTVPKFTVGESFQARTFWLQLMVSTPELANCRKTEQQLIQRYRELVTNNTRSSSSSTGGTTTTTTTTTTPMNVGESPPILEDWRVDASNNRISGLLNQRRVWMSIQMLGSLEPGDRAPTAAGTNSIDPSLWGPTTPLAGGFVEAAGGRVYELGQPGSTATNTANTANVMMMMNDGIVTPSAKQQQTKTDNPIFPNWPWVNESTVILAALIVTSILSTAIGFQGATNQFQQQQQLRLYNNNNISQGSPAQVTTTSSATSTPSIREQRARTEARVLQEQRVLQTLTNRLASDRTELQQLQQEEKRSQPQQQQQQQTVDSNGRVEMTVSEKRARTESRVLREERLVQDVGKRLEYDRVKFEKLLQEEAGSR